MKQFEKYFKFPLSLDEYGMMVFTEDYSRAFDFLTPDLKLQQRIVKTLNGKDNVKTFKEIKHEGGEIYVGDKKLLRIRSWGRLTGSLNLKAEKAAKIQDEFAEWIVEKLKA